MSVTPGEATLALVLSLRARVLVQRRVAILLRSSVLLGAVVLALIFLLPLLRDPFGAVVSLIPALTSGTDHAPHTCAGSSSRNATACEWRQTIWPRHRLWA